MSLPDTQLTELLLKNGVTDKALTKAQEFMSSTRAPLYQAVTECGILTEEQLGAFIAGYYNVPFVMLSKISIPEDVAHIIPERVARKQKALVFAKENGEVKIALADPSNKLLPSFIARKTGMRAIIYYATEKDIVGTIQHYKKDLQKTIDELLKEYVSQATTRGDEMPIIKLVDELIKAASEDKASDIHIEPEETASLIRFRIDGVLQDALRLKKELHDRIISRIKVLSNLRTDEHLSAQDGKMTAKTEEENLDIRVSIIPVTYGEKAVLRLLSSSSREFTLSDLGMNMPDLQKVTRAFNKSYGMILSTGPTGSGKTTSIYSILKILNTREKNIMTIEDPVEYRIIGANQVQVNDKTNLTFANGLRSILRQDPNVIFVGEIRDKETAGIAVNAALTGHLVLSTLHTNDAATSIPRLFDFEVEPFLVASTLTVIIAQRLVRQICSSCKTEETIPLAEMKKRFPEELIKRYFGTKPDIKVYKGKGCKVCKQTGYKGRLGIFEVLEVDKDIIKLISEKANSDVIAFAAISNGMSTMLDNGLEKVSQGATTIEEVIRVTKNIETPVYGK